MPAQHRLAPQRWQPPSPSRRRVSLTLPLALPPRSHSDRRSKLLLPLEIHVIMSHKPNKKRERKEEGSKFLEILSGAVDVHYADGNALVWDYNVAYTLRKRFRIVGSLIGSLPSNPRQNQFLGLPLFLLPEEATLALSKGWINLIRSDAPYPSRTAEAQAGFEDNRQHELDLHAEKVHRQSVKKRENKKRAEEQEGASRERRHLLLKEALERIKRQKLEQRDPSTEPKGEPEQPPAPAANDIEDALSANELVRQHADSGMTSCRGLGDLVAELPEDHVEESDPNTNPLAVHPALSPTTSLTAPEVGPSQAQSPLEANYSQLFRRVPTQHDYSPQDRAARVMDSKDWTFPHTAQERLRYRVFCDLHEKGFYMTSASKFGGDFLVYPGDPIRFHSHLCVIVMEWSAELTALEIVSYGRLGVSVKKAPVLAAIDPATEELRYFSLEWAGGL